MSEAMSPGPKPPPRLRTHEQVMAEIENRLNNGTLKAGDRLPPERQFAEALGVSRGAVREALRILEAIGVVEAGPGSGPNSGSRIVKDSTVGMGMLLRIHLQLASFTETDLLETRLMLERLACRKAASIATGAEIYRLRRLVDEMRAAPTTALRSTSSRPLPAPPPSRTGRCRRANFRVSKKNRARPAVPVPECLPPTA